MRTHGAVGDMRGEALRRGPPQVHAFQHLRPVLCVCASSARLCRPQTCHMPARRPMQVRLPCCQPEAQGDVQAAHRVLPHEAFHGSAYLGVTHMCGPLSSTIPSLA